jgi:hypothetical protein
VHLRQADTHLVSCLFETGIYFTGRGGVQLRKTGVEMCLLGKEVISRVEGCDIVASNLHIHYINMLEDNRGEMYRTSCSAKRMVMYEGIGTSRNLAHGDMLEEIQSSKDVAGGVCRC